MIADGVLNLGIDLNAWPWVWLAIAVIFSLIELTLLGGSFVLLPFAASAFVASLLAFYDVPIEAQWAVFVLGGSLLFFGMYRWVRKFMRSSVKPLGVGADRLVGMTAIVTERISIDDTGRRGRVTVAGETWGAITELATTMDNGARVLITAMRGTRVVVQPISSEAVASGEEQP